MTEGPTTQMRSSRPYLLRAMYEWLIDHHLTPYLMVNTMVPNVRVPEQFIEDGKIVLNIEPNAIHDLYMGNEAIEFKARFSGAPYQIYLPVSAVTAIYSIENGRGMVFGENGEEDGDNLPPRSTPPSAKKKPHLRIVK